jgi:LuxR family maltose regulon positive regulatory protein
MLATEVPISKTKITLPRRRMDLLSRARLLEILDERLDRQLIIISAAAGYGKTSLLIDLAYRSDLPFCWLSLDSLDREPQRFIAGLIAAIAERFPEFGKRSTSLLNGLTSLDEGLERLLVTLVNEIYDDIPEHFALVLDDFHILDEATPVLQFVNRFLQLVGENCHLVLASRTLPELRDIPLLVAREQIGGLDFSDLAFQADEIQALLAQNRQIHLSDQDARKLVDATEGWITGLQFTDITRLVSGAESFRAPERIGVSLFDYLGQQVLEQQSDEMQEFMLRSSLLEEFDVGLCDTVLGPLYAERPNWSKLVGALVQKNLFTLPVGTNGQWLRYHHLFRDYLQSRFRRECPQEVEPILRRLAQFQDAAGQWEKAYQLYSQLGDTNALAVMIERAGIPMYQHAMLTLQSWLKALPPSVMNGRPGLLSLSGNIEMLKGNGGESLKLFDRSIAMYRKEKQEEGLALALVRRGGTYRFLGRYEEAMRDANEVLENFKSSDELEWIHADALRVIGLSRYRQGRTLEAIKYLQQALDIYVRVNDSATIPLLLMETGLAHSTLGNYTEAKASYEQALKIWKEEGNLTSQALLLNNYGSLHQQLGEYEQAAHALEEGLLCAKQSGYKRMEALIALSLGDVYSDVEDFEIAMQTYRQADELIYQLGDRFLRNYLSLTTASLALLRRDTREAQALLERTAPAIKASDSRYEFGLYQLLKGRLELQSGRLSKALPPLKDARRSFSEEGREMESLWSAVWLAAALYQNGQQAAAREELRGAVPNPNQVAHAAVLAARQARDWLVDLRKDPELKIHLRGLFERADRLEDQLPPIRRQLRRLAHTIQMPTPSLTIRAFGSGQVSVNGKILSMTDWQTQSVRELFFFFLAANRPITREQVGTALWPDTDEPGRFKMRFKNEIYRLRRAVGQETILFDGQMYGFNPAVDHEYDVEAFEAYVAKAKTTNRPTEQIGYYERAVNLVQGKYLEDIGSSWILPEQERLHQAYISAALALAELYQKDGQSPKAIEMCQRALARDKTAEPLYRLLMEIYHKAGDRPSVIHVYHLCETAMKDTFQMPPSSETRELYGRLTAETRISRLRNESSDP